MKTTRSKSSEQNKLIMQVIGGVILLGTILTGAAIVCNNSNLGAIGLPCLVIGGLTLLVVWLVD